MKSLAHLTNKDRREHYSRVAALGCIITGETDVEIHHCYGLQFPVRRDHRPVIPLAARLHRGSYGEAIHAGKEKWESIYGTQEELLELTNKRLSEEY